MIIPLAPFQPLLGWVLVTTQALAGLADPRQETHPGRIAGQEKNLIKGVARAGLRRIGMW